MKLIRDKEIIKKEKKIREIEAKIVNYRKSRVSRSIIVKWELKYQELNNYLNNRLNERLILEDDSYKDFSKKNIKLLRNNKIIFKTSRNGVSITGTHATVLKGKIHKNGHIYCQTEKTNFPIFTMFSQFSFPSAFKGRIDCLGNVRLMKSETGMALIKNLPKKLEGLITEDGIITIKTTEREGDIFSNGSYMISRIVSTYAFEDEQTEQEFFSNRNDLLGMIKDYKNKITAANNK
jgi:hypothetical protein